MQITSLQVERGRAVLFEGFIKAGQGKSDSSKAARLAASQRIQPVRGRRMQEAC